MFINPSFGTTITVKLEKPNDGTDSKDVELRQHRREIVFQLMEKLNVGGTGDKDSFHTQTVTRPDQNDKCISELENIKEAFIKAFKTIKRMYLPWYNPKPVFEKLDLLISEAKKGNTKEEINLEVPLYPKSVRIRGGFSRRRKNKRPA